MILRVSIFAISGIGALRRLHDLRHTVSRAEEKRLGGVRGDLGMEQSGIHPLIHSTANGGMEMA
jgi:hypothetical protein